VCRNRTAELLFGYSETEVLGCNIVELLVDEKAHGVAAKVVKRISEGKTWAGQIPLRKKSGEVFMAMVTDSPFYDSDGRFLGIVEVSYDIRSFEDECILPVEGDVMGEDESPGDNSHQQHSRQFPFAAAITNLVCLR
jgi:PAS domain S-box-containing protein